MTTENRWYLALRFEPKENNRGHLSVAGFDLHYQALNQETPEYRVRSFPIHQQEIFTNEVTIWLKECGILDTDIEIMLCMLYGIVNKFILTQRAEGTGYALSD